MARRSELSFEDFSRDSDEDEFGAVSQLLQRSEHTPDANCWRPVIERYVGSESALYLALGKGPIGCAAQDAGPQYGVLLYWPTGMLLNVKESERLSNLRKIEVKRCQRAAGHMQRAVLIDVRQCLEMPQRTMHDSFDATCLPAEKWLLRFDQGDSGF